MKNFIWFIKKMIQITPQVWAVRVNKNVAITIFGEDNARRFADYKRRLLKMVEKEEKTIVRNLK